MMGKLVRFMLLIPLLPAIYAFSHEAVLFVAQLNYEDLIFFLIGIAVYILLYVVILAGRIDFIEILEHELTHAVAALMLFQMPRKLVIDTEGVDKKNGDEKGGAKKRDTQVAGVTETIGCFWVLLAPYFLPLFTLPLLLVKLVVPPPYDRAVDVLIGFTLAFHYVRLFKDLRVKQSDITTAGTIFAAVVSIFLNLLFLVLILALVTDTQASLPDYLTASIERAKQAYITVYEWVKSLELFTPEWITEQLD